MSRATQPGRGSPRSTGELAREFDGIAEALRRQGSGDVLSPAERALLTHVPSDAQLAIDVGCGDGHLTRALAHRGLTVVGVDLSPRMIELARSRTVSGLPVKYKQGDVMRLALPQRSFDVVVSCAMVHHVHFGAIVRRLAELVAPGGTLLIQDVMERRGLRHLPVNVLAFGRSLVRRTVARGSAEVMALYETHGRDETYLHADQVEAAYRKALPDARVVLHVDWRYSVIWRRRSSRR